MTDYATDNVTAFEPPEPSLVGVPWFQRPNGDYSSEMNSRGAPTTPISSGGSTTPRSNVGLVFPR